MTDLRPTDSAKLAPIAKTRATFTNVTAQKKGKPDAETKITVHFNPASLQITLANTLEEKGKDKKQYISKSSAKLTMDLIFDTTDTGVDVRFHTAKVAKYMEPAGRGKDDKVPPTVQFDWGTFAFRGMVESYKETIDFFSHDGVPLRASVNLTLTRQNVLFTDDGKQPAADTRVTVTGDFSPAEAAAAAGNVDAGRQVAAANGLESMRLPSGPFTMDASLSLGGPVAFATGGAGIGISASAGIGISAGAGIGISAGAGIGIGGGVGIGVSGGAGLGISGGAGIGISGGAGVGLGGGAAFSASGGIGIGAAIGGGGGVAVGGGVAIGASAGAGVIGFGAAGAVGVGGSVSAGIGVTSVGVAVVRGPAFGGAASRGVPASMGAFAGLRPVMRVTGPPLDTTRLLPRVESRMVVTGGTATFRVGGQANIAGPGSLGADVSASAQARIRFEEE